MDIEAIRAQIPQLEQVGKVKQTQEVGKAGEQGGFAEAFSQALNEINNMQVDAENKIERLTLGDPTVNTHNAMIALEQADISFQLMNAIRGKLIRAYEEVMRTQL